MQGKSLTDVVLRVDGIEPEQRLAAAVIAQALDDALILKPDYNDKRRIRQFGRKREARQWFGSHNCAFWFQAMLPNADKDWRIYCEQARIMIGERE